MTKKKYDDLSESTQLGISCTAFTGIALCIGSVSWMLYQRAGWWGLTVGALALGAYLVYYTVTRYDYSD